MNRRKVSSAELVELEKQITDRIALRSCDQDAPATAGAPDAIVIRVDRDGDSVEVSAGERRWRASGRGSRSDGASDRGDDVRGAERELVESMSASDLTPIEAASRCAALRDHYGLSVAEIARRVDRDRSVIAHLIRLLDLPVNAQELISAGELTESHGRVLLRLKLREDRVELATRCATERWSVRELERQTDERAASPARTRPLDPTDEPAVLRYLARRCAPLFDSRNVAIKPQRHGSYELRVSFDDLDDINDAISKWSAAHPNATTA